MPDAVDTVIWAPDGGWRYHLKYVEQFTDINKLYTVASRWIIIDVYSRCTDPWTLKSVSIFSNFIFYYSECVYGTVTKHKTFGRSTKKLLHKMNKIRHECHEWLQQYQTGTEPPATPFFRILSSDFHKNLWSLTSDHMLSSLTLIYIYIYIYIYVCVCVYI
jgi:hypothetical protein